MMSRDRLERVLSQVDYRDWRFHIDCAPAWYLQVHFDGQQGRKWYISSWATDSEIVQTALMAVLAAEEHEARERFKYRGKAIFGPHFNVERLVELCAAGDDALDIRQAG